MEAAEEIARQLRLRAIGGIIVVDFIDMDTEESNQELIHELHELFRNDRCKARGLWSDRSGACRDNKKKSQDRY